MPPFQPPESTLTTLRTTQKTILITGGASGIGLSTALYLSSLNPSHNLILLDQHSPAPSAISSIPSSNLLFHKCDITSWPSLRSGFANGYSKFGRIDYVFINAGITESGDQFFTDALDADGNLAAANHAVLSVDLNAAADTAKLAIHYLRKNGKEEGGSIVMTASLAGYLGTSGMHMYSAAKHGVVGLLRSLKHECAALGIAVSVVAPAITLTPMVVKTEGSRMVRSGRTPEEEVEVLRGSGVRVNRAETVAAVVGWLFASGMEAAGKGVLVQNDCAVDVEGGLARSREAWMGKEMLDDFRGGSRGGAFAGKKGGSKI